MLTRSALLFIFSTVLCGAYNMQEEFCDSQIVVRAMIMSPGFIESFTSTIAGAVTLYPPQVPKYYRQYELQIVEVFKTNHPYYPDRLKNIFRYAITKDTRYNADADGCEFYQEGESALFYFDDWENIVIKRNCAGWRLIPNYARKVLRNGRYGCECALEECLNRIDGVKGIPDCGDDLDYMFCTRDTTQGCIWKGARKTCVHPAGKDGRRGRHH